MLLGEYGAFADSVSYSDGPLRVPGPSPQVLWLDPPLAPTPTTEPGDVDLSSRSFVDDSQPTGHPETSWI